MVAIYADGANLDQMAALAGDQRVKGFTTNPSLMKKAGVKNYRDFAKTVLGAVGDKPVSFEVLSDDQQEMERQALEIASWAQNIYVKIPVVNMAGEPNAKVINRLFRQNVKVNVTAILGKNHIDALFQNQGISKSVPMILSIFAGRIADTWVEPEFLFNHAHARYGIRQNVKYLWASTRQVADVKHADRCGADIITLTPDLIGKLSLKGKDLDEYAIETVKQFHEDGKGIAF